MWGDSVETIRVVTQNCASVCGDLSVCSLCPCILLVRLCVCVCVCVWVGEWRFGGCDFCCSGALFWTLFVPTPLEWHPAFTVTTWFSLGGLLLMIPGIVYYHTASVRKKRQENKSSQAGQCGGDDDLLAAWGVGGERGRVANDSYGTASGALLPS